jgi:hypothetical protein
LTMYFPSARDSTKRTTASKPACSALAPVMLRGEAYLPIGYV